jgi:hypothetical protein
VAAGEGVLTAAWGTVAVLTCHALRGGGEAGAGESGDGFVELDGVAGSPVSERGEAARLN